MKFWTVQTKDVIRSIQERGFYQPNFNISRYLYLNNNLSDLYYIILKHFNKINGTNLPGVVYSFARSDNYRIYSIDTIEEFKQFIRSKQEVIYSLWKNLEYHKEDFVIFELDYDDNFNPLFIDINDFQFLMPPLVLVPPYTLESVHRILDDIMKGEITFSEFPSNVIQAHLPYIERRNIVNIYPFFGL